MILSLYLTCTAASTVFVLDQLCTTHADTIARASCIRAFTRLKVMPFRSLYYGIHALHLGNAPSNHSLTGRSVRLLGRGE